MGREQAFAGTQNGVEERYGAVEIFPGKESERFHQPQSQEVQEGELDTLISWKHG
jgi:hypothetical protein